MRLPRAGRLLCDRDSGLAFAIAAAGPIRYACSPMGEEMKDHQRQIGRLAVQAGKRFPLQVCQSRAGYYVGTLDEEGLPYSRESTEYWRDRVAAERAIETGTWTQKTSL